MIERLGKVWVSWGRLRKAGEKKCRETKRGKRESLRSGMASIKYIY